MNENIAEKLNKDKSEEEKKNFIVKTFSVIAIVLFFTGIAFLKVIGDRYSESRKSIVMNVYSGNTDRNGSQLSGVSAAGNTLSAASSSKIPVYIIGAVKSPGIYEIDGPTYFYRILELAGGFTAEADRNSVNLAFLVSENMMIKVPTRIETSAGISGGYSSELIVTGWVSTDSNSKDQISKVNINTADAAALTTLPGIGESTAKAIIDYRTKNGPYKTTKDVMKVSGIKENRYNQIKDFITAGK
ncbi:MAG: ComEA family DNA-binding protein [Saccharofermentanales bacterium]